MSSLTLQRGAVPITLDRPRIIFFDHSAAFLLVDRYGFDFAAELYSVRKGEKDLDIRMKSADALAYFLWAGLQADAREHGETLSVEHAAALIMPTTVKPVFAAVLQAFLRTAATPAEPEQQPGKPQPERTRRKAPPTPGPTLASTSTKRRVSR